MEDVFPIEHGDIPLLSLPEGTLIFHWTMELWEEEIPTRKNCLPASPLARQPTPPRNSRPYDQGLLNHWVSLYFWVWYVGGRLGWLAIIPPCLGRILLCIAHEFVKNHWKSNDHFYMNYCGLAMIHLWELFDSQGFLLCAVSGVDCCVGVGGEYHRRLCGLTTHVESLQVTWLEIITRYYPLPSLKHWKITFFSSSGLVKTHQLDLMWIGFEEGFHSQYGQFIRLSKM